MLIWFLALNSVLAAIYAIARSARGKSAGMALFFVFLPGLGFVIYYLPLALQAFLKSVDIDREAVLTHVFEVERQLEHPNLQEALNVVPVEDAMAVSGNSEKRALLLKQLKKDLQENYRIILAAERDEDSESAHYVAAAKMEVYRLQQARWLETRRDYEENPDDPKRYHAACSVLVEMLGSDVLSNREQAAYRKRLCDLVQVQLGLAEGEVTAKEYEAYLDALVELGRYEEAEALWHGHADSMRNEATYFAMLKMLYQKGDREEFRMLLGDLRKNRQVRLSPHGLEQLRYWSDRLAESGGAHD